MERKDIRILVIEDSEDRLKWFQAEFGHCDLTMATNAKAGISYVKDRKFDLIFLDHDLGHRVFVDSNDENTGYQVAKAIVISEFNNTTPVVIHSWNPTGAENMRTILTNSIYIPFGTFKIDSFKFKSPIDKQPKI